VYQEERVVRAVRLPVSTDEELRALAAARGCSINQLVAEAVEGLVRSPGDADQPDEEVA
jgi:predicted DNA-binding ribbon-helix-helix protein